MVVDRTNCFYPDSLYLDSYHLYEFCANRFIKSLRKDLINYTE